MVFLYPETEELSTKNLLQNFMNNNVRALSRYEDAIAEAAKIEEEQRIRMSVVGFQPVHFGWPTYEMPVGEHCVTLKSNVVFYPVGMFSTDVDFVSMKWYEGCFIRYLSDWFTKFVALKEEKTAAMYPQPIFKDTFSFEIVSEADPVKPHVNAWLSAWVVLPRTMETMSIIL